MKTSSTTSIFSVSVLIFLTLVIVSCHKKKTEDKEPPPDVKVNSALEMDPPVAEKVFVQKIDGDGDNILLFAQFSKTEFRDNFLAIDNGDEKVVLRDDGKGGDEKASDGLFTVRIKTNVAEFEKALQEDIKQKSGGEKEKPRKFINRALVSIEFDSAANNSPQVFERFTRGLRVPIDRFGPLFGVASLGNHSLIVRDLQVVEDPDRTWNPCEQIGNIKGPWTFNTLMRELASTDPAHIADDIQLSDFVEIWLNTWLSDQNINSELVPRRMAMQTVIKKWKDRSQTLPMPRVPKGKLDMRAAPFKLLAIVNRFDLRGNSGYGVSNAGEGRFVFCLLNECSPTQFTVIFEYGVPKTTCAELKTYAQQWYDLKNLSFSDPQYRQQLEDITNQFTRCGTSPRKPNQSSLNQLRTNEIQLDNPWELREFQISGNHHLQEVTVKQEPAVKFNGDNPLNTLPNIRKFVSYVNTNALDIAANSYEIPESLPDGTSFLGGKAHTLSRAHIWNDKQPAAVIANDEARHIVSLNTCSACHGGETRTSFTHISPAPFHSVADLSGFLTGITVSDPAGRPVGNPTQRKFSDIQRRADDLEQFVGTICRSVFELRDRLTFRPIKMTH